MGAIMRLEYESRWRKPSKFAVNLGTLDRLFVSIVPGVSLIQDFKSITGGSSPSCYCWHKFW